MADLRLSGAVLNELITAFNGFGELLAGSCADIRTGDAAVTGDDPLAGDVHDFAGSWHYGLTQLGQHGDVCVKQLKQVQTTFDQLEKQLTAELRSAKGKGGGKQ